MPNQYTRARKRGYKYYFKLGLIEVDWESGCWLWLGAQYKDDGYGKVMAQRADGRWFSMRAQRYFYTLYRRQLPPSIDVGHNCHRRLCVRLKHLKPETHADNMKLLYETWNFGPNELSELQSMMLEGRTVSYMADKLLAPRPIVMRHLKRLEWRQDDLFGTD